MNQKRLLTLAILLLLISSAGCGFRHYLGLHGPSTRNSPEIHTDAITEDGQCLHCHAPTDNSGDAPLTSHAGFQGCLKCHSGAVK